jgi:hypothetical protein
VSILDSSQECQILIVPWVISGVSEADGDAVAAVWGVGLVV